MRERERDRERERESERERKIFLGGGGVSQKIFINYEKSVKRVTIKKKFNCFLTFPQF